MKKNIFFATLVFCVLLISCKKKEEQKITYRLTAEDLTWNIYHLGDTIKLLSNLNHPRNYCITRLYQGLDNSSVDLSWNAFEYISIGFSRTDSGQTGKFFMDISCGTPGDNLPTFSIDIDWEDGLGIILFYYSFSIPREPNIDTLTVNNVLYHNVYGCYNLTNLDADTAAKAVYYDKQKGWLRIELKSGEKYDRIN
ncbi:MAG: hypothetical protein WCQ95_00320 [Bacteroidota bacterium]